MHLDALYCPVPCRKVRSSAPRIRARMHVMLRCSRYSPKENSPLLSVI